MTCKCEILIKELKDEMRWNFDLSEFVDKQISEWLEEALEKIAKLEQKLEMVERYALE